MGSVGIQVYFSGMEQPHAIKAENFEVQQLLHHLYTLLHVGKHTPYETLVGSMTL